MSESIDQGVASISSTKSKRNGLRQFIDDNMSKDYNAINKKQDGDENHDNNNDDNNIDVGGDANNDENKDVTKDNATKDNTGTSTKNTIIVTKEFTEHIIKYITYDDIIKQKEDEIKELKKKRVPHEKFIMEYLEKLNEEGIDVTGGALKISKSETKTPVSKDNIKDVISKKIQDVKIIEEILNDIEKLRKVSTKTNLRRSYAKEKAAPKKTNKKK